MRAGNQPDHRGPTLVLVFLVLVALLVVAWGVGRDGANGAALGPEPSPESGAQPGAEWGAESGPADEAPSPGVPLPTPSGAPSAEDTPEDTPEDKPADPPADAPDTLPGGGARIFGGNRFLVAYYGTAQTPAMGVLGESDPDTMDQRLRRAAAPFRRPGQPIRHVYELIATIADAGPGPDGDYSHDIPRAEVERYVRAAHRNQALLLLDIQPGRTGFLDVAKRWAWALRDPWVGLALDPEWRMGRREVPARTIGQVRAAEVNRTSAWLSRLTVAEGLPEKLFVLHQFRTDMVEDIGQIQRRPGLAMVQHVDGFGTRGQKRATYDAVARPRQFTMGFKLFYDEDVDRMGAPAVHELRPRVRFVSFQ